MFEIKFIRQIFYWIDTSVRKRKSRLKAIFALKSFLFLQGLSIILKKKKKKSLEKKSALLSFVWFCSKNILSLLAGKIARRSSDFLPPTVKYIFCFKTRLCSNSQIFFLLSNTPYAKKSKRDSLYFDLLPDPLKALIFFVWYVCYRQ